jgi:hypothetical protein
MLLECRRIFGTNVHTYFTENLHLNYPLPACSPLSSWSGVGGISNSVPLCMPSFCQAFRHPKGAQFRLRIRCGVCERRRHSASKPLPWIFVSPWVTIGILRLLYYELKLCAKFRLVTVTVRLGNLICVCSCARVWVWWCCSTQIAQSLSCFAVQVSSQTGIMCSFRFACTASCFSFCRESDGVV